MVQKWTLAGIKDGHVPKPDDGGHFVSVADYAKLEAENTRLRALIEASPHSPLCGIYAVFDDLPCDCLKSKL